MRMTMWLSATARRLLLSFEGWALTILSVASHSKSSWLARWEWQLRHGRHGDEKGDDDYD
jgi:hypothetical protein